MSFPFIESKQKIKAKCSSPRIKIESFVRTPISNFEREREREPVWERERETETEFTGDSSPLLCLDWIGDGCALPCLTVAPSRRVNHLATLPWLNWWWVFWISDGCHEDYEDLTGKSGERKPAKSEDLIGIQRNFGFRNFAFLIEFLYKLSPYVSWRCIFFFFGIVFVFGQLFLFFFLCCNVFHFRKLVGWFCNAQ